MKEMVNRLMKKPILILLACAFIPALINIDLEHNWGDDFAQYLMHSHKLAAFQNPAETNYMYNPNYAVVSPPVYPMGFPLLLSPISLFKPATLVSYKIFMQVFFLAFVVCACLLAKKHVSVYTAFFVGLLLAFNPLIFEFKNQILSDIPFAVFFILSCIYIEKGAPLWKTGLLVAFTILIRTIGIALLGAWILKLLIDQYKKTGIKFPSFSKTTVLNFICVLALPLIVFYINQKSAATGYSNQFEGTSVIETIKTNFSIQLGVINNLFIPDLPSYGYYNYTWVIFPLLILSGLIYHLFKKGYFLVFVFICYESLVLIFPYQYGTFRFLIPVLPILFLFVAHVVELFILNFKNRVVKIGSAALIYVALFAVNSIACAEKIKTLVVAGPEHYAAQEMFNFVKTKTPATAHLLFTKPKAMGYFGQRKCVTNKPTNTNKEIARLLLKYHVDHIVQGLENPALDHYIQQESAELDLVFSNKEFRVFKIKVK